MRYDDVGDIDYSYVPPETPDYDLSTQEHEEEWQRYYWFQEWAKDLNEWQEWYPADNWFRIVDE